LLRRRSISGCVAGYQLLTRCRVVAIELAEVELVSRDAVELLLQVEDEGIEVRSCPAGIREWITNERKSSWRSESSPMSWAVERVACYAGDR
jgi:hypothetical protein